MKKALIGALAAASAVLGIAQAAQGAPIIRDFDGSFETNDGQIRCELYSRMYSPTRVPMVRCQSLVTGRVVTLGQGGRTTTSFATRVLAPRVTNRANVTRKSPVKFQNQGLTCTASRTSVFCGAYSFLSVRRNALGTIIVPKYFGGTDLLTAHDLTLDKVSIGRMQFLSDRPKQSPVPIDYRPPVADNSYLGKVIPDRNDVGGEYGSINPRTGLPRTFLVPRDVFFKTTYYISCSRCTG